MGFVLNTFSRTSDLDDDFARRQDLSVFSSFNTFFSGFRRTASGEFMSAEKSMTLPPVFAAVRNISDDIAKLPLVIERNTENGGTERATDHELFDLVNRKPNPHMGKFSVFQTVQSWAMLYGAGFLEIQRDGAGVPEALWPIHPSRVVIEVNENGNLIYRIMQENPRRTRGSDFTERIVIDEDMIKIAGIGDGYSGFTVWRLMSEIFGKGIAANQFESSFFGKGARPSGVIEPPEGVKLDPTKMAAFKDALNLEHQRDPSRSHGIMMLEAGWKWVTSGQSPRDAELEKLHRFTAEQVAQVFRIPLEKIGQSVNTKGWNSLELTNTNYLNDALMPWILNWEGELNEKLLREDERGELFFNIDETGMVRGDMQTRKDVGQMLFNSGAMSQNELRRFTANLDPVEGGDLRFMQLGFATVDRIIEGDAQDDGEQAAADNPFADEANQMSALYRENPMAFKRHYANVPDEFEGIRNGHATD